VGDSRFGTERTTLADMYPGLSGLLEKVEATLSREDSEGAGFINLATERALSGPAKRLRPSVLLLAAECAGGATDAAVALAGVVELVHAASLVHDDVIDEALSRRGRSSANALWGNKISVLLGDYILARALAAIPGGSRERFLPELARVAAEMCIGQLSELRATGRLLAEPAYMEIVQAKTARLFAFCGWAGAVSSGASPRLADALARFGQRFGVAYQFADDILDVVGTDGRSGKPEGKDLAERKSTLPLILAASIGGDEVAAQVSALLGKDVLSPGDGEALRLLVESVGAAEAAWEKVRDWLGEARAELVEVPECAAKDALLAVCADLFPMPVMAVDR